MDIKQWLSEYPGLQLEYENLYLAQGKQESRMLHAQNTASQLDDTRKRKTEIEDAITSLDDPLDRAILRARYIHVDGPNLTTWRDVALRICGDDALLYFIGREYGGINGKISTLGMTAQTDLSSVQGRRFDEIVDDLIGQMIFGTGVFATIIVTVFMIIQISVYSVQGIYFAKHPSEVMK